MHKIEYDRCIYEIKSKVYFLTEHSIGYYWSIDLKTNAFWNTHRSVCNAISMRWIWLNAIPRSLSLIYFYFFSEFIWSHTFDTIKFPHFILFHFTSMRTDTLNMNLFEKFRLNFLVSASRSLFRIGGLFHRFRNVFCLCFFLSILPNSIAIRLKCRCVCCTAV